MKSAWTIALELLSLRENFDYTSDHDRGPEASGYHQYDHRAVVGGHHVHVEFRRRGAHTNSFGQNQYHAHFYVNGTSSREHVGEHGPRILHHVARVVDHFVRTHKPHAIHFEAGDNDVGVESHKHDVYGHFADRLARAHGGDTEHDSHEHSVYFP